MNEYIYKQSAIEALGEEPLVWNDDEYVLGQHSQWLQDMAALEALSPVDVEHNIGQWIPVTRIEHYFNDEEGWPQYDVEWVDATEADEVDGLKCSECGTVFDFTEARNWCSECGADMRALSKSHRTLSPKGKIYGVGQSD